MSDQRLSLPLSDDLSFDDCTVSPLCVLRMCQLSHPPLSESCGGTLGGTLGRPKCLYICITFVVHLQFCLDSISASCRTHPGVLPWRECCAGAFHTVAAQIRQHLGLPTGAPTLESRPGVASAKEVQALLLEAQTANAAIAAARLTSMARLLQSLPALQMPDSVGDQV